MKNKLKIICILMLLCLFGCENKLNKENIPIYNSNDTVENKQNENIETEQLEENKNNKDEVIKEEQIPENQTTTSQKPTSNNTNTNNNNNNNNSEINNTTNNNDEINDSNNEETTNNNTLENEEKNENLTNKNETEDNLENDTNDDIDNDKLVRLDIYYSDSCSYCHQLFSFLDSLDENLKSKLIITKYNIDEYYSEFYEVANKFSGNANVGIPYTVFNNQKAIVGYSESKYLKYINEFIN